MHVMEQSAAAIEKKSQDVAFVRKLEAKQELKEELRDELTTKEDLARVESRLELKIAHLDKKFTVMFVVLLAAIFFVNKDAVAWFATLLGLIK